MGRAEHERSVLRNKLTACDYSYGGKKKEKDTKDTFN